MKIVVYRNFRDFSASSLRYAGVISSTLQRFRTASVSCIFSVIRDGASALVFCLAFYMRFYSQIHLILNVTNLEFSSVILKSHTSRRWSVQKMSSEKVLPKVLAIRNNCWSFHLNNTVKFLRLVESAEAYATGHSEPGIPWAPSATSDRLWSV